MLHFNKFCFFTEEASPCGFKYPEESATRLKNLNPNGLKN